MKIGAQLYSLRQYCQTEIDLGRTLEKVAAMGYTTVQLSAIGPIAPKTVKKLCDDNGLKIVLTHNAESKFLQDIDKLIEEHQIYGCKYVGLGAMNDRYRVAGWLENFARDYEGPAAKLKDAGMRFMYHNHSFEFMHMPNGQTLMDRLLELMPAELMGITADTYWLQFGGVDVVDWLAAHPERLNVIHLKDMIIDGFENRFAPIGSGNLNFKKILETVSGNGVTEYAMVEQDNCYGKFPFDCMESSCKYLNSIGYK